MLLEVLEPGAAWQRAEWAKARQEEVWRAMLQLGKARQEEMWRAMLQLGEALLATARPRAVASETRMAP